MNTQQRESGDARLDQLIGWLRRQLASDNFAIAPASADASFRRYFRATLPDRTLIAMDAPPPHEDCRPYVHVAGLLRAAGVNAPEVIAQDFESGFLLISDLGSTTYLDVLDPSSAPALYLDAIEALIRWQRATRSGELPPYNETLLRRELDLFPNWYVRRHLAVELTSEQDTALEGVFRRVLANNLAQPVVNVHRDYHSRNLMVTRPCPGVLDFQDAVCGPITYDLVSLLKDAYVEWEEERVLDWTIRYWERARQTGLPVALRFDDFYRDFEWMGVQRHLKVLGIFARLFHRDGKARYLDDLPLVLSYVHRACRRYPELAPLGILLDRLENREVRVGYTF